MIKWCVKLFGTRLQQKHSKARTLHDDVIKWKHFPRYWPFVREIHRSPVNSPHKGHWRGALIFSLICVWINGWVNNSEAGDLRRHRAHFDVIVMAHDYLAVLWWGMKMITDGMLTRWLWKCMPPDIASDLNMKMPAGFANQHKIFIRCLQVIWDSCKNIALFITSVS